MSGSCKNNSTQGNYDLTNAPSRGKSLEMVLGL